MPKILPRTSYLTTDFSDGSIVCPLDVLKCTDKVFN